MGEQLVINEFLINHHQKTKQKPICYMTKSLISDGLPINPPPPFPLPTKFTPLTPPPIRLPPNQHLPPYMLTYLPTSTHIILPTYISKTSLLFDELFFMWILHPYLKIWIQWVFYLSHFSYFYYPPMFFLLTYLRLM